MDPIIVPEDLSGLTTEQLVEFAQSVSARVADLNKSLSAENVTAMETLGADYERIDAEMASREADEGELAARAAAISTRVLGEAAADDGADDGDEEGDDAGDGDADDGDADAEAEGDADSGDADAEGDAAGDVDVDVEVSTEAAAERPRSATLAARIASRQAAATKPREKTPADVLTAQFRATRFAEVVRESEDLDVHQLAQAITKRRIGFGNRTPSGVHDERITMATASMDYEGAGRLLNEGAESNFVMLNQAVNDVTTLVASGGVCAPFAPRYDIFRTARPHSPVEDNLFALGAPRGGIRYVVPPDFREARAGVGTVTCEEDGEGYGSGSGQATPKPCVHLDCPQVDEACVTAVSHCIEFGNLQFRVFPEWVEGRILDLMVEFASVKEVLYLDGIDAASTATTTAATDGYGAYRRMLNDARVAAEAYRRRNGMDDDAVVDWLAPGWVPDEMLADRVNDNAWGAGLDPAALTKAAINADFRAMNVNPIWYYDSATGEGQAFTDVQAAGALNEYPTNVVSYMYAPGTFVRLDGGTLDVGLVRDSVLNATNDLQLFAEQWVQLVMLGIESVKITHEDVCPNGAAPEGATLITCP